MVFKVLNLKRAYNFTIERQTGCLFGLEAFQIKECEDLR